MSFKNVLSIGYTSAAFGFNTILKKGNKIPKLSISKSIPIKTRMIKNIVDFFWFLLSKLVIFFILVII
jgi:hypothetical protein